MNEMVVCKTRLKIVQFTTGGGSMWAIDEYGKLWTKPLGEPGDWEEVEPPMREVTSQPVRTSQDYHDEG